MFTDLVGQTPGEIKSWLKRVNEPPYRFTQIFDWIYKKVICSTKDMLNLPVSLREKIDSDFTFPALHLEKIERSLDQETTKYLWTLSDGKQIESVLIVSGKRRTVCVSSQVGCPVRCAFCASGKEGFVRNLSAGEIIEQILQIQGLLKSQQECVTHVVFMGMGEPLENYDQVIKALHLLIHPLALHLSARRVTISTVGVIEGIRKLMHEKIPVNLALSLHAPNQHLRKKIIPHARKYALEDILEAAKRYSQTTKRDLTYEYILLKGINDGEKEALQLGQLLKGTHGCVNLIPYNPVSRLRFERPDAASIKKFRDLLERGGLRTTWRYTKGKDIAAACGQLALKRANSDRAHDSVLAETLLTH